MSIQVVDTHAHLCSEAFAEDREQVWVDARAAGVKWVLNVADSLTTSLATARAAAHDTGMYATAGVHPHEAGSWDEDTKQQLLEILTREEVVAVGEIGLDYHYDFAPRDLQREVFRAQLSLAKNLSLPVVVHNREADVDTMALLTGATPLSGVLHCFWSDECTAREAIELGYYIGVGGPITFGNTADLRTVLQKVPLQRIVLETDSPYLAPKPFRGRRNEPAYVVKVAEALAELHGKSVEYVARQTTENAETLFLKGAQVAINC